MVEKGEPLRISDFTKPRQDNPFGQDTALPQEPYSTDLNLPVRKASLYEKFMASGEAPEMDEESKQFTQTMLDSFEQIFDDPHYREGTSDRKKFDLFISNFNSAAKFIKQVNDGFPTGEFVSLYKQDMSIDGNNPFVLDMARMVGANLYIERMIEEQLDVARKNDIAAPMEAVKSAVRINTLMLITAEEDGFRLGSFADADFIIAKGRLADAVAFIFKRDEAGDEAVVSEDYHARNSTQSYLSVFSFMDKRLFRNVHAKSGVESESLRYAERFADSLLAIRNEVKNAVFDVAHPEHETVSGAVLKVMGNKEAAGIMALYLAKSIQSLYRDAKRLSVSDQDSEVANLILEAIDREVELHELSLIKAHDLSEIGAKKTDDEVDYEDLRKKTNEVFSHTSKLEYELDGGEVISDAFVAPDVVNVRFEKGKSYKFDIELQYANEHGEEFAVDYAVDSKKGEFEWSLLDDPDIEPKFKNAFLNYSQAVLGLVLKKAEEIHMSKKKGEALVASPPSKPRSRGVTVRPKRAPFEGRKEARTINPDEFAERTGPDSEQEGIHREIIIPDESQLQQLLKKLDHVDRDIVISRLQGFNERGVGRILVLKKGGNSRKSSEGNPLGKYVISGKNGGAKGIRVLVERSASTNGSEVWEIRAVDYKKNIYAGNALDKI